MKKYLAEGSEGTIYDLGNGLVEKEFFHDKLTEEKYHRCSILSDMEAPQIVFPKDVVKEFHLFNKYKMKRIFISDININNISLQEKIEYLFKVDGILKTIHTIKKTANNEPIDMVHCDVKYDNFPIDINNEVWVLDMDNCKINEFIPLHLNKGAYIYITHFKRMLDKGTDKFLLGLLSLSLLTGIPEKKIYDIIEKDYNFLYQLIESLIVPLLIKEYYIYLFFSHQKNAYLPNDFRCLAEEQYNFVDRKSNY